MRLKYIAVDEPRTLDVSLRLVHDWRNKVGVFRDVTLPQERHVPVGVAPEVLARYYVAVAPTQRGGQISEDPLKCINSLFQTEPDLFVPALVAKNWNGESITKRMQLELSTRLGKKEVTGFNVSQFGESWAHNFAALHRYWGDDVRNFFWGITSFQEAYDRIKDGRRRPVGMIGMRMKIFTLLVIWLQEAGLIAEFPIPIPVDFHAMRVLWATGCIQFLNIRKFTDRTDFPEQLWGQPWVAVTEGLTDEIALWMLEFMTKHGISARELNPAIWVLSREFCSRQLQSQSKAEAQEYVLPEELITNPMRWPSGYRDPCVYCPVASHCSGVIPSAPYYDKRVSGKNLVLFQRVEFPHKTTNDLPGMLEFKKLARRNGRK
jgi:hypothetical protein